MKISSFQQSYKEMIKGERLVMVGHTGSPLAGARGAAVASDIGITECVLNLMVRFIEAQEIAGNRVANSNQTKQRQAATTKAKATPGQRRLAVSEECTA